MVKKYFRKVLRKNRGGGADWKDNMKIIPPKDTFRRFVDGKWQAEEKGVCMPAGTCLMEVWVKTQDFDGNPYPDNEGRAEITIAPWGTYIGNDGKTYGDELSIANLSYDGQNKGRYFDNESQQFQLITPEIANQLNMIMNPTTSKYEYKKQNVGSQLNTSVDNDNASPSTQSSRVETVRVQQQRVDETSSFKPDAPATNTTEFDDDIPW